MDYAETWIQKFTKLGNDHDQIRAVVLTSSRANPNAPRDILSDYDVILYTADLPYLLDSDQWFEALGAVLLVWRWQDETGDWHCRMVLYEDGTKVDFSPQPVERLKALSGMPSLPEDLDVGYRVLLDKDGLTKSLKAPTYRAFIPNPPTEAEYIERIVTFWMDAAYVPRYLWRDDLMAAKFRLDQVLKQDVCRSILEWSIEIDKGWNWKPGAVGKGIKKALDPETYEELMATYAGGDIEELWEDFFRTTDLFRKTAVKVGASLGYQYPYEMDRKMMIYMQTIQALNRNASSEEVLANMLSKAYGCQATSE